MANIITRRYFLSTGFKATMATAFASLANVPGFIRRALAEGTIGGGKKVLFIFFRGGNDGINNIIPVQDPAYYAARPAIGIPKDPDPVVAARYAASGGQCDVVSSTYPYAIPLGNGFAALHPALYELAPVYNDGELALIHRVAYPRQSRSHFDSEKYWENGVPYNNGLKEGIFYRTMVESGLIGGASPLTAVSVQSNMPLIIRGDYPMTNLGDPLRYNLLGVNYASASSNDRVKQTDANEASTLRTHPDKDNRTLVYGLGKQFHETLDTFQQINFANNDFYDPNNPTARLFNVSDSYYKNLKAAAQILANTGAVVAGTQLGGFDTHTNQGGVTGTHANLLRRIGHTMYALKYFFSNPAYNKYGRDLWNDIVVVTLSEFGRTSIDNASLGTDHAEASVMYVAGGAVNGGVYACDPSVNATMGVPNWTPADPGWTQASPTSAGGSMMATGSRYLKRAVDYRSVLGEIIRDHLGATQDQLNRIIPAYANESVEHLKNGLAGGTTPIIGELGIV